MQAAYEFELLGELTDVGAGQHPDGEEGESRETSAPDEQSACALPGSHCSISRPRGSVPQLPSMTALLSRA